MLSCPLQNSWDSRLPLPRLVKVLVVNIQSSSSEYSGINSNSLLLSSDTVYSFKKLELCLVNISEMAVIAVLNHSVSALFNFSVNGNEIDAAAIHTEQSRVVDPLDYVPESGPIEDLDLPNILPDLPG